MNSFQSHNRYGVSPSASATGRDHATQRRFTDSDILILNTIRVERSKNTSWHDIAALLESGYRDDDTPPSALTVPSSIPIAQYGRLQSLQAVIQHLETQIAEQARFYERQLEALKDEQRRERQESQQRLLEMQGELSMYKTLFEIEVAKNNGRQG